MIVHSMRSGRNILKVMCLICFLQTLLTIYLILKVYVSNVMRPDLVNENEENIDYDNSLPFNSQDFIIEKNTFNKEKNVLKTERELLKNEFDFEIKKTERKLMKTEYLKTVEIWGKAAIASYLWEHILGGTKSVDPENPSIYLAQLSTPKCLLIYKEGPGLQMHNISMKADPLVLVLNGRTQEKVLESKNWLAFIKETRPLLKVVLFLLGNEKCNNVWLQEFLYPQGPVHGAFITYDVPTLDDKMTFQWPLGVATYRHFPLLFEKEVNPSQPRPYICNLQATNYMNSSRAPLFTFLQTSKLAKVQCIIKERKEWSASESPQSSGEYVDILLKSDITLCPTGFNTETYRVYEAMAAGSIPVIEDVPSKGSCDEASGWRLLKRFNPPVIWIKEWSKLKSILIKERKMSIREKAERRKRLLNWYEWFKLRNSDRFTSFIHKLI